MNKENLSNAINMIDDDMIIHAGRSRHEKSKSVLRWTFFKSAAAILAICLVAGSSAYALINGGFFKDELNAIGTVTGQTYENAAGEISVTVNSSGTVDITFLNYDKPPYTLHEAKVDIYIGSYKIVDESGNKVLSNDSRQKLDIVAGNAVIAFNYDSLSAGVYTLLIDEFIAESKADQPLSIMGNWKVEFTVE